MVYEPAKIALAEVDLGSVASACACAAAFSTSTDALTTLAIDKVLGVKMTAVLRTAVAVVLGNAGLEGMRVHEWHFLCAHQLPSKPTLVRDVTSFDGAQAMCVLLCIDGEGMLSLSKPSEIEKPTMKMQQVRLNMGDCVVYQCNLTYAIQQTTASFLHCVCSRASTPPSVTSHQPIRFPCPYNRTYALGDVRAYPKAYDPDSSIACAYRGGRWQNVLDHLTNCKARPVTEKYLAAQKRRRERNEETGNFPCEHCSVAPFTLKNTLVQHIRRNHKPTARQPTPVPNENTRIDYSLETLTSQEQVRGEGEIEDFALFSSFEQPQDIELASSHAKKHKKLQRRRSKTNASMMTTDHTASILDQFEMCMMALACEEEDGRIIEGREAGVQTLIDAAKTSIAGFSMSASSGGSPADGLYALEPLSEKASYEAVTKMLSRITSANIRQPAGRMGQNAGEMSYVGVTRVVAAFGQITVDDVFADIGSGIGNVSIQVAVQSRFAKTLCIEMRPELTALTTKIIADNLRDEPRLAKLEVVTADISKVDLVDIDSMVSVSHIFSHNTVFDPDAMLKFEDVCFLPKVRLIALTRLPCTRHRDRCSNSFCQAWTLVSTVHVPVTYKDGLVEVFIFSKSDHLL